MNFRSQLKLAHMQVRVSIVKRRLREAAQRAHVASCPACQARVQGGAGLLQLLLGEEGDAAGAHVGTKKEHLQ